MDTTTLVGFIAAFCTSSTEEVLANRKAGDLSLLMFSILTTGVGAWVLYGVLKHDVVSSSRTP